MAGGKEEEEEEDEVEAPAEDKARGRLLPPSLCCSPPPPHEAPRPDAPPRPAEPQEQEQTTFDSADAGASHTFPQTASAVRKGGFMVIKGRPCKARALLRCTHAHAGAGANTLALLRWWTCPPPRRASTATPSATSWRWTSSPAVRWRSWCRRRTTWRCGSGAGGDAAAPAEAAAPGVAPRGRSRGARAPPGGPIRTIGARRPGAGGARPGCHHSSPCMDFPPHFADRPRPG